MNKTNFEIPEKYVPIFLLALCALSYGLTLTLGYFWDDWVVLWNFQALGARGVFESYAMDRPIHGYFLGYLIQLLGTAPLTWHLAALLMRAGGILAVWQILRQVWPGQNRTNALVAALLAVYPGFTQQPLTVIYILQLWGAFLLWAVSIGIMLAAIRPGRWQGWLTGLACFLALTHLALSEYFIGLELLRPILHGMVLAQTASPERIADWRTRFKVIFHHWWPYLAALVGYLLYRLVFFQSGRATTDSSAIFSKLLINPVVELSHRAAALLTDPLEVTLLAWMQPLNSFLVRYQYSPRIWWACLGLATLGAALTWGFLTRLKPDSARSGRPTQALRLGLAAIFLAGLPIWGINREASLGGLGDRYAFPFIFGSALLVSALLGLAEKSKTRYIIAALLVGSSVGFHAWQTETVYRAEWNEQQLFQSQLSLRAPGLKPGTSLWVSKDPARLALEGDYGLALPVNWVYAPEHASAEVNYWVFPLTDEFLGRSGALQPGAGASIQREVRNVTFRGSPEQTLVIWFAPPACLRVIDAQQPELLEALGLPASARFLLRENPILTAPGATRFPVELFGERKANWCATFEQADLARQQADWKTAVALGEAAAQAGLEPAHPSEWLPFLEADLRLGRFEQAAGKLEKISTSQFPAASPLLCAFSARVQTGTTDPALNQFLEKISVAHCRPSQKANP